MRPTTRSLWITAFVFCAVGVRATQGADMAADITADVVYGHKDGMALTLDVYKPEKDANGAGAIFMVSGGWYSHWFPPKATIGLFQPLLDEGFTVFAVRHGSSPKYKIPEIIEDVRRSVRFIRLRAAEFGVDPERLGVFGASAGGHLSLVLGTTGDDGDPKAKEEVLRVSDRVAVVVAYFPPTDVRPWVTEDSTYRRDFPALQFDPAKAADCSPVLHASEDDPPTLLVHGDKDELVPLDHSQKMLAEFKEKKVPCELLVIEGAAHGFAGKDGKRATEALVGWFKKHLAKR
ncbi:MAG: peptidase S9 [Planctomycetes bacterium RBG_13_63_9]|nr:MAG: peptidase S9 [Planctomycetes bacterium RBG_13_63_9]